jgi:hypothetical protein
MYLRAQYQFDLQEPFYENSMDWLYNEEMESYKQEALRKMSIYLDRSDVLDFSVCVAFSFCENVPSAMRIFKERNLKNIHAYALIENKEWFREEFDKVLEAREDARFD